MPDPFHRRFNLDLGEAEARERFVNRAHNAVFEALFYESGESEELKTRILTDMGVRERPQSLVKLIGDGFFETLHALESYWHMSPHQQTQLGDFITYALERDGIDLGVRWLDGHFLRSGSSLLDDGVVNDVLGVLSSPESAAIRQPFEKGLGHLVRGMAAPEILADTITDMYESLEALAKRVTGRDRDLSANRESLVAVASLPTEYSSILKSYIKYGNRYRHAPNPNEGRPQPSFAEAEAFVYLTGLLIRLTCGPR